MNYPQGPHDDLVYKVLVVMLVALCAAALVAAALFNMF